MAKKMLIDGTHEEETRVAIVEEDQLVEFDYESKVRKQLKGGIYLAKVTRVEPSLQAAFVNFGGNRHGFLPFSEIHPDYFRIPVSDREALMAAQDEELERLAALEAEEEALEDAENDPKAKKSDDVIEGTAEVVETEEDDSDEEAEDVVEIGGADKPAEDDDADLVVKATFTEGDAEEETQEGDDAGNVKADDNEKSDEELDAEALEAVNVDGNASDSDKDKKNNNRRGRNNRNNKRGGRHNNRNNNKRGSRSNMRSKRGREVSEEDGGRPYRFSLRHKYKIQEVVKRGQVMLIQVSKEERGNKGAAVTSYLSLPGRYCVLMPNSPRAGGVSRKIGNFKDRKRMREILKELSVPQGMSVILRTAGVSRTKAEIKRDLDYLTRLWNTIREDTLSATAPALINEEGNLIKRSIRDLYTRDIDEVMVAGERAFKTAKDFMKMLVPSHAKKVQEYKDERIPLFHRFHVEKHISAIGSMNATLKSGGYLVINPTEALVSVDVNSGRATKERHIEETALNTNLEAAEEVARQLRLRDLGGLVVIDFIDMEERRNNRKVENKLRAALSDDRARIQVGRISSFGLLELSRQRLNPSITEAQFETCPHCDGTGVIKTLDFAAISAMRGLEEEGIKGHAAEISLNLPNRVAVYILNNKRPMLDDIEKRYDFRVYIRVNEELKESEFLLDIVSKKEGAPETKNDAKAKDGDDEGSKKPSRNRRRGKRGGKRNNNRNQDENAQDNNVDQSSEENKNSDDKPAEKSEEKTKKKPSRKSSAKKSAKEKEETSDAVVENKAEEKSEKKPTKKAAKKSEKKTEAKKKMPKPSNDSAEEQPAKDFEVVNAEPKKKKKGWWSKIVE